MRNGSLRTPQASETVGVSDLAAMPEPLLSASADSTSTGVLKKCNRGVYFLANNKIYDLAVAFLNSFRTHNPSLSLCLIPYDNSIEKIRELSSSYSFSIYNNESVLERCDKISRKFHGHTVGQYRKFATWEGAYDQFIYVDCDTVVLRDLSFVFDLLPEYHFIFSHSDIPRIRKWVWKDSIYDGNYLSPEQISFSANTGFFCSKKQYIDLNIVEKKAGQCVELAGHMELYCAEQPFLNYVVVTSGQKFTSIFTINNRTGANLPVELWAGYTFWFRLRQFLKNRSGNLFIHDDVFLIHWAGEWQPTPSDWKIYHVLSKVGIKPPAPGVRLFMKKFWWWRYYRNKHFFRVLSLNWWKSN